jgi:hypothetical protein
MLAPRPVALAALAAVALLLAFYALGARAEHFVAAEGGAGVKMLLVHATWCPHCTSYLKSGVLARTFARGGLGQDLGVAVELVDYDKETARAERYGVQSFPTVLAVDARSGKKLAEFRGDRYDPGQLVEFARSAASAAA